MTTIIGLLIVVAAVLICVFYHVTAFVWTLSIGLTLLLVTVFQLLTGPLCTVSWLVFLFAATYAHAHGLRQRFVVKPMLSILKRKLPSISQTEQAAIDAGDTWWEKELFCGSPDWSKLMQLPRPSLTLDEEAFLDNQVNTLCEMLDDWDIVQHKHDLPKKVWAYIRQEKFFAMVLPKEYGGLGFSALAHSTVVMKIATRSISAAVTVMVPNSLGPGELLVKYGTEDQKNTYLPRLASGKEIPCFALTAPEAGSDAGSMVDCGVVCRGHYQGKEVLGLKLNWDKRYITLAPVATLLGLAIHLYDPDHLLGDKTDVGITLCLIPTDHDGVEIGTRHMPMYSAFMNGPTRGKDVFIPLDWIIGGKEMAGQGWRMLMECLSIGRSISLPALSTACAKSAYRQTGAYARVRTQFNMPISSFEGVEESLGYIAGYTYLLEACRMMTASAVDQGVNPSIVSAIAKYHMTELSRVIVTHAMDIHAGHMIQVGPKNNLANAYLTMPISITVEGANILTRNLIIFGQGAIRCHPYLLDEVALIQQDKPNVNALDKLLLSHVGYLIRNTIKTITYGLTGGRFISTPFSNPSISRRAKQLTRMSTALAFVSDVSLIMLGGSLKRREKTSARLGDILSQLYLASCVLKYFQDHHKPQSDVDYVCWNLQLSLFKIQQAFYTLLDNYPIKWLGKALKWCIFPLGVAYQEPSDRLTHKIVSSMLSHNELRDRLSRHGFIHDASVMKQLDIALEKVAHIEPIIKKMKKGVAKDVLGQHFLMVDKINEAEKNNTITQVEADLLKDYITLYQDIIKVDEFNLTLSKQEHTIVEDVL